MKTNLKASLLTKEVTRLKNKYPEARWWRLAELVRTLYLHQCGFRAEHENGRRILSFDLLTLDRSDRKSQKPIEVRAVYRNGFYSYIPNEETPDLFVSRLFHISPAKPFGERWTTFKEDFYNLLTSAVILNIKWKVEQAKKKRRENRKMKENKTQALIEEFNALEDTLTVLLALKDTPSEREKVEEELLLAFAQFRTTLENLAEGENK